jgi:hypothetical protein
MPGISDAFLLYLEDSYNNYTKSLKNNDNIKITDLRNKLNVDLDNVKQKYKLNPNNTYTPEETKEVIQTNFNNGLYNSSFGSSPKEVFSNYKSERKLLVEQKYQNIKLISQITLDAAKPLNDQTLLAKNQYKEAQMNNLNTINNTRRSLKGHPHVQLSKYKTHKNTEMQSNVTDLSTEYSTQQEAGSCCCCTSSACKKENLGFKTCCGCVCYVQDCGGCSDLKDCCGGKAYDGGNAEACCGGSTYDPEVEHCCSGTMFCSYYSTGTNAGCYYNNITLSNVIVDGSCTNGFKWQGYIHWKNESNGGLAFVNIDNIGAVDGGCAYAMQCGQGSQGSHSVPCSSVGGYPYGPGQFFNTVTTQSLTNSSITLP